MRHPVSLLIILSTAQQERVTRRHTGCNEVKTSECALQVNMKWSKTSEDYFLVFCVLFINFCLFGIIRSGALIYVALIDTFGCSHELASWPLTLAGSSICLIGKYSECYCYLVLRKRGLS